MRKAKNNPVSVNPIFVVVNEERKIVIDYPRIHLINSIPLPIACKPFSRYHKSDIINMIYDGFNNALWRGRFPVSATKSPAMAYFIKRKVNPFMRPRVTGYSPKKHVIHYNSPVSFIAFYAYVIPDYAMKSKQRPNDGKKAIRYNEKAGMGIYESNAYTLQEVTDIMEYREKYGILETIAKYGLHEGFTHAYCKFLERHGNNIGRQLLQGACKPVDKEDLYQHAYEGLLHYVNEGGNIYGIVTHKEGRYFYSLSGNLLAVDDETGETQNKSPLQYSYRHMASAVNQISSHYRHDVHNDDDDGNTDIIESVSYHGYNNDYGNDMDFMELVSYHGYDTDLCDHTDGKRASFVSCKALEKFTDDYYTFWESLPKDTQKIICLLVQGYTYREVMKNMHYGSTKTVFTRIEKARDMWETYKNNVALFEDYKETKAVSRRPYKAPKSFTFTGNLATALQCETIVHNAFMNAYRASAQ